MKIDFKDVMQYATRLTQAGRLSEATAAIQRALGSVHLGDQFAEQTEASDVIDVTATVVERPESVIEDQIVSRELATADASPGPMGISVQLAELGPGGATAPDTRGPATARSRVEVGFLAGSHTHASLTRSYKLYVPPAAIERSLPLVVMLHGCTQDPDDFAAGTDMNRLAFEHGFCVLYPAQAQQANPSKCWNWFKHNHQGRDHGEPAVIASMAREVMKACNIDSNRVYVAGLSAGGAMAANLGAAYPDLFAAVGVHSGLAPGAAQTLPEAMMAMNGTTIPASGKAILGRRKSAARRPLHLPVPVIVFHGDQDRTVHPRNADQVVSAARSAAAQLGPSPLATCSSEPHIVRGVSESGQRYTRHVHAVRPGQPAVELWILHGAGHAWSGGSDSGSYTDPTGPSASREMLRFFLENPRRPLQ